MTHPSKRKGTAYEREVVDEALSIGLRAQRAWGSNGESLGHHSEVDVLLEGTYKLQAKRRASLPAYLKPSRHVDWQVLREDRGISYVVMPLGDCLNLVRAAQHE